MDELIKEMERFKDVTSAFTLTDVIIVLALSGVLLAASTAHADDVDDPRVLFAEGRYAAAAQVFEHRWSAKGDATDGVNAVVAWRTAGRYARALSLWSHGRLWSEVRSAYEMIPFLPNPKKQKPVAITLKDGAGQDVGQANTNPVEAKTIHIDRGGYGVDIQLEKPMKVKLGATSTLLIQLVEEGPKPTPASEVKLKYRLAPFGG